LLSLKPQFNKKVTTLSKYQLAYWRKKIIDKEFHPGNHGGLRWSLFNKFDKKKDRKYIVDCL